MDRIPDVGRDAAVDDDLTGRLRELWQTLLGVPKVDAESNFFELGGHSMLATRLMARTRRSLGVELPANLIFQFPVFAEFAAQAALAARHGKDAQPVDVPQATERERGPLSLQQQQLMLVEVGLGPSPANKVAVVLEVEAGDGGRVDADLLRRALHLLVDRHPALRTGFRPEGAGHVQLVLPAVADDVLDETDLRELPPSADALRRVRRRVRQAHLRPFDLAAGGLLHAQLFRRSGGADLLALHLHHLACDGRSQQVLVDDLAAAYDTLTEAEVGAEDVAVAAGPADGVSYLDYALWQEGRWPAMLRQSRPHWRAVVRELTDDPARVARGPAATVAVARSATVVAPEVLGAVRQWAAGQNTTSVVVLTAAVAAAVSRLTGLSSVGVGTLLENRPLAEVERTVGPFANSTLLAVPVAAEATPRQLVQLVGERLAAARQWSDLPLETLIAGPAADAAVDPAELIDVVLSVELAGGRPADGRLRLRPVADDGPPLLPVAIAAQRTVHAHLGDADRLRLVVEHADDPDEAARARALLDSVVGLLTAVVSAPDVPLPTPLAVGAPPR
ncbi:condensation domain-containing protein [Micromonospora sp. NPDC002296]|uniref:condensation domain-containing protein n=1 Tax=Micromonospora sp. NPDC002296 TaxID=3154271 RepID=UPI003334969D